MTSESFNYDRLCIRDFIVNHIGNIQSLCFFLENTWSVSRYDYKSLSPGRMGSQAQEIVQIAKTNGEIGELVFYLCWYWLKDYKGNRDILVESGLAQQLILYAQECQNKGHISRYQEVQKMAKEIDSAPPKKQQATGAYKNTVFVSYAWGGESEKVVDQIQEALQKRGIKCVRDKNDLSYRDSLTKFMERIGRGDCIIVVISDKYLRSPNCMFELVEIAGNQRFRDRIFPVVLPDADIYDPVKRLAYIQYWEDKRNELASQIKKVDPANLHGIREDMDLYDRIRDRVSELTGILKDMNTLTPAKLSASGFATLLDAIERALTGTS